MIWKQFFRGFQSRISETDHRVTDEMLTLRRIQKKCHQVMSASFTKQAALREMFKGEDHAFRSKLVP